MQRPQDQGKNYAIGVDFGTLSARAALVDLETGEEIASATQNYPAGVIEDRLPDSEIPLEPETALQDPQDYLKVLENTVQQALTESGTDPNDVVGMGIDFTASSPLPTTADGTPLCLLPEFRNSPHAWVKLWKHHAAQPEADHINAVAAERNEAFMKAYAGGYSCEWLISKLLQTLNDAPEVYAAAERFIEAGDWVVWRLTGNEVRSSSINGFKAMAVCPNTTAGAASDNATTYPSSDFFKALDPRFENVVSEKLDAPLRPLGESAGGLTADFAQRLGLNPGTPVAVANIDAHVAAPACAATQPGRLVMIMGTSTCYLLSSESQTFAEGVCGVVRDGVAPGYWGYEAGQAAVGDIFAWFVDRIAPKQVHDDAAAANQDDYAYLEAQASQLQPGQSGLIALDWWNGSRSTLMNSRLTGQILGLTLQSRPHEIYRTLIEATAFGARQILETFTDHNVPIHDIVGCGGLAKKNPLLMQLYADITNRVMRVAASEQTCALGSAMFGAVASGHFKSIHEAAEKLGKLDDTVYTPNPKAVEVYNDLYQIYKTLHDTMGRDPNSPMKKLREIRDRTRNPREG